MDTRQRTAGTYDLASDTYDDPVLSFWERFGRRTVQRLDIPRGARVLDACCGSGASALPAGERVGPEGSVLGVDLAQNLLSLARAKAADSGLAQVSFRQGDIASLGLPDAAFDAVICVFGIFFLDDMAGGVRELWRMVRPGGVLAVTTWGKGVFGPADGIFWEEVRSERPDLDRAFAPWDRIGDAAALRALLAEGGVPAAATIEMEPGEHPLRETADFWRIVMGSGYRATVEQLDPAARLRLRGKLERRLREDDVRSLGADVVYAAARKPAHG
ncbi:MAG: class I SAM-dependent methyltransferase [Candidatus Polarisedimenticolia bacterium]